MILRRFVIFGLTVLAAVHARGDVALTADTAVRIALENNPDLAAAEYIIAEAAGRARSSGRLSNPELEMEIAGGKGLESRMLLGVTQRFPVTARLRLERELSRLKIERARLEVEDGKRRVAVAARRAFHELAAARDSLAMVQRQIEVSRSFAKSLLDSAAEGFGSQFEGRQAALASDMLDARGQSLRAENFHTAAQLCGLLGLPADTPLIIEGALDLPPEIPAARPADRRPDLELAEISVRAGATDVSLAMAARWDDLSAGVFVEGERSENGAEGGETVGGVMFKVPLPIWQSGRGRIAEKQAAQARMTGKLQALRLAAHNEVIAAHRVMAVRHRAAVMLRDQLLPSAGRQVADAEAAYGRGEGDIETVFRARERLVEIGLAALEARTNYFRAQSVWMGALGQPAMQP